MKYTLILALLSSSLAFADGEPTEFEATITRGDLPSLTVINPSGVASTMTYAPTVDTLKLVDSGALLRSGTPTGCESLLGQLAAPVEFHATLNSVTTIDRSTRPATRAEALEAPVAVRVRIPAKAELFGACGDTGTTRDKLTFGIMEHVSIKFVVESDTAAAELDTMDASERAANLTYRAEVRAALDALKTAIDAGDLAGAAKTASDVTQLDLEPTERNEFFTLRQRLTPAVVK